ncbi:MAG: hypothetical protein E6G67_08550 [Actinobacteria bacterium]|nr:MAG: hypothetical protein E6G67_08550 [Actinomycetota bacterium]
MRCVSSPARASTPAASATSPRRPASRTGCSTTTSPPRTRCWRRSSARRGRSCSPRSARWRRPSRSRASSCARSRRSCSARGAGSRTSCTCSCARSLEAVERGQAEGAFRSELDARLAATIVYGALEEILTGWVLGELADGEEGVARAERTIVDLLCGGLAVEIRHSETVA